MAVTGAGRAVAREGLAVGLAAWREAGCRRIRTVPLNLSGLTVPRRTAQRGLSALECAGLVAVEHRKGRPPLVTLRDALAGPSGKAA